MEEKLHVYNPNSKTHRHRVRNERIRKLFVCLCVLVVLAPFYVAILYAFKPATEITANRLAFTQNPTLENFRRVIFENPLFRIGLRNSLINTIPCVLILMACTSMARARASYTTTRWHTDSSSSQGVSF